MQRMVFGQLEHHGITKQYAREKMASFTADRAAVKVVSKGALFGMYVACRANVYSKSGNKIT